MYKIYQMVLNLFQSRKMVGIYCCYSLKNQIEYAGDRGISIVINGNLFYKQFRCITYQQEKEIQKALLEGKINKSVENMMLSGSMQIYFCPQCGMKLHNLVKMYPQEYFLISEKHKSLGIVPSTVTQ